MRWIMSKPAIPLSNFEGWVRQVDPRSLNQLSRIALEFAFPGFLPRDEPTQDQVQGMVRVLKQGADYATWQNRPKRRFSGGEDLPGGRYYTLAVGSHGHDEGTLM